LKKKSGIPVAHFAVITILLAPQKEDGVESFVLKEQKEALLEWLRN
jgi:hypothetical protein